MPAKVEFLENTLVFSRSSVLSIQSSVPGNLPGRSPVSLFRARRYLLDIGCLNSILCSPHRSSSSAREAFIRCSCADTCRHQLPNIMPKKSMNAMNDAIQFVKTILPMTETTDGSGLTREVWKDCFTQQNKVNTNGLLTRGPVGPFSLFAFPND